MHSCFGIVRVIAELVRKEMAVFQCTSAHIDTRIPFWGGYYSTECREVTRFIKLSNALEHNACSVASENQCLIQSEKIQICQADGGNVSKVDCLTLRNCKCPF